jgi:predicted ATPase
MINRVKVLKGFASELVCLQGRVFQFSDGFNVLFGSNGCGKSSLMKCIKAYCAVEHAGWSKISNHMSLGASSVKNFRSASAKDAGKVTLG